jgi:hypothetical protein
MLALSQTSVCFSFRRQRTYRSRKIVRNKPCMKNANRLECAIRHRRCKGCPFNDFFKAENILKYTPPDIDND